MGELRSADKEGRWAETKGLEGAGGQAVGLRGRRPPMLQGVRGQNQWEFPGGASSGHTSVFTLGDQSGAWVLLCLRRQHPCPSSWRLQPGPRRAWRAQTACALVLWIPRSGEVVCSLALSPQHL